MTEVIERPIKAKTPAKPRASAPGLGIAIDDLWQLRENKRELETQIKAIELAISEKEEDLLERMGHEGLDSARGSRASVSTTRTTVAQVEDWDKFWTFIFKNKYSQLLQRRVSDPAYRELLELGKKVPGVTPFEKTRLNLRSL